MLNEIKTFLHKNGFYRENIPKVTLYYTKVSGDESITASEKPIGNITENINAKYEKANDSD